MHDDNAIEWLLGVNARIRELNQDIRWAAPLNVPVLISGERGTGKRLVVSLLQRHSQAPESSIVTIDCTSSAAAFEEFGTSTRPDETARAVTRTHRTLVLQHVDRLNTASQALLYRHLEISGDLSEAATQVRGATISRVIATTETDLFELVAARQFRDDLYYRLNAVHLVIPSLRERREDIPVLVRHWLSGSSKDREGASPQLSSAALERLLTSDWPGNVGELRRVVAGLCAEEPAGVSSPWPLPFEHDPPRLPLISPWQRSVRRDR